MKQVFDWAPTEGREKDISAELREAVQSGQLSDADIEKKIAEMQAARTARDFQGVRRPPRRTHRRRHHHREHQGRRALEKKVKEHFVIG